MLGISLWLPIEIRAIFNAQDHSRSLDFSQKLFNPESFQIFCTELKISNGIKKLKLNKNGLSSEQAECVLALINSNSKKGLKLLDEDDKPFGNIYTDWSGYNEAKQNAYLFGMRETTRKALSYLGKPPYAVVDFGAGTGQDTIPLLEELDCSITAVDADEEALGILESKLSKSKLNHLNCFIGPFMQFSPARQADLFISSFTWPYRPKEDFQECWEKTVSIVKPGGVIAGHFFGPTTPLDPGMTYHTEEELKELLEKDFTILWFKKDPKGTPNKIYGGEDPPWGDLFHVVARKK